MVSVVGFGFWFCCRGLEVSVLSISVLDCQFLCYWFVLCYSGCDMLLFFWGYLCWMVCGSELLVFVLGLCLAIVFLRFLFFFSHLYTTLIYLYSPYRDLCVLHRCCVSNICRFKKKTLSHPPLYTLGIPQHEEIYMWFDLIEYINVYVNKKICIFLKKKCIFFCEEKKIWIFIFGT